MSQVVGRAFEDLSTEEMYSIQGGGWETWLVTVTAFSSMPCACGGTIGLTITFIVDGITD